ncbi:MAG: DUF819 family protein [Bacteroidota bacterium]
MTWIQVLAYFILPLVFLFAEKRIKLIQWLGPVILCYAAGFLVGQLGDLNTEFAQTIMEVSAVLAVPLVLFSANIPEWLKLAPKTLLSFLGCVIGAVASTTLAYSFLGDSISSADKFAGMAVGVYTGGTPNLAAVGVALDMSPEQITQATVVDIVLAVPYLLLLFTIAHRLLQLFLPHYQPLHSSSTSTTPLPDISIKGVAYSVLLSGACLGVCFAAAETLGVKGPQQGLVIVVGVTLLGIAGALFPSIRALKGSFEAGEYLLLVFCVAVGSLVDLELLLNQDGGLLGFMAVCMYGSIFFHLIIAKVLKIDADTALITSVAAIMSPVFVAPAARVMQNREIITSGMTAGVLGFAVGNLLGLLLSSLLGT